MKGFIIYSDYITIESENHIRLFGRLENNQSFLTINRFSPYFYVKKIDIESLEKPQNSLRNPLKTLFINEKLEGYSKSSIEIPSNLVTLQSGISNRHSRTKDDTIKGNVYIKKLPENCKTQTTNLKNFEGEEVIKVIFKNKTDLNNLYKEIHKEISIYEADIKPQNEFLIEKDILTNIEIEGEFESSERIDRIYKEPKIHSTTLNPKLKIISIDTESDKKTGKLFCIGI